MFPILATSCRQDWKLTFQNLEQFNHWRILSASTILCVLIKMEKCIGQMGIWTRVFLELVERRVRTSAIVYTVTQVAANECLLRNQNKQSLTRDLQHTVYKQTSKSCHILFYYRDISHYITTTITEAYSYVTGHSVIQQMTYPTKYLQFLLRLRLNRPTI